MKAKNLDRQVESSAPGPVHGKTSAIVRGSELWKIRRVLAAHQFPPQIVRRVPTSFDGKDWLFEIKHDGFRMLAIRDGGPTRLFTRNGYDFTRRNRLIAAALDAFPVERFVLDGELVVLDDDGRSNFAKLAHGRTGTHYFAFDLLLLGDADLRPKPLDVRKATLATLLQGCRRTGPLLRLYRG